MLTYMLITLIVHGACARQSYSHDDNSVKGYSSGGIVKKVANQLKATLLSRGTKQGDTANPPAIDLVFLLDASLHYGKVNYIHSIDLIEMMLAFFSISPGTTNVAIVTYGDKVNIHLNLKRYSSRTNIEKHLRILRKHRVGGKSNIGSAYKTVKRMLQTTPKRIDSKQILVVITDGYFQNQDEYLKLKHGTDSWYDIARYAILTGENIKNKTTLNFLSNEPTYLFQIPSTNDLKSLTNLISNGTFGHCQSKGVWMDECNRRCQCINGKVTTCQRVRKEINSMTVDERNMYINALRTLSINPKYKPKYDEFITVHSKLFGSGIHERSQFLPWHRWFILTLENMVQEIDCRVIVPYWDWSVVSNDPWDGNMLFSGKHGGVGGTGRRTKDNPDHLCVQDGPFSATNGWYLPNGQCLERELSGNPPDTAIVQLTKRLKNFAQFEVSLRVNLHDTMHCQIGGTMCSLVSAYSPEFFFHHGHVDKIWWDAQHKSQKFYNGTFVTNNVKMLATPYHVKDFINLENQPGGINVTYQDATLVNMTQVNTFLKSQTTDALLNLQRPKVEVLKYKAIQLFKVSSKEQKFATSFQNITTRVFALHPVIRRKIKSHGITKYLGFKIITQKQFTANINRKLAKLAPRMQEQIDRLQISTNKKINNTVAALQNIIRRQLKVAANKANQEMRLTSQENISNALVVKNAENIKKHLFEIILQLKSTGQAKIKLSVNKIKSTANTKLSHILRKFERIKKSILKRSLKRFRKKAQHIILRRLRRLKKMRQRRGQKRRRRRKQKKRRMSKSKQRRQQKILETRRRNKQQHIKLRKIRRQKKNEKVTQRKQRQKMVRQKQRQKVLLQKQRQKAIRQKQHQKIIKQKQRQKLNRQKQHQKLMRQKQRQKILRQ